jgi:hypothetical protein
MIVGFDDNLAGEATRVANRLHGLLTQIHPSLERVLGPRLPVGASGRCPASHDFASISPDVLGLARQGQGQLTSPPAEAGGFFPRGLSFLLLRQQLPRINGGGRWYAQQSYASSTDLTSRQPGGRPGQLGYHRPGLPTLLHPRAVAGGRRSALAANRLPLPCSTGVRFLPSLKAGVSTEESRRESPSWPSRRIGPEFGGRAVILIPDRLITWLAHEVCLVELS